MHHDAAHFTAGLLPVADPGFRRRWGKGEVGTYFIGAGAHLLLAKNVTEKCIKMKGACVPSARGFTLWMLNILGFAFFVAGGDTCR